MQLKLFSELYERIQVDSSILLLGQNYLSIGEGRDRVWENLVENTYTSYGLSKRRVDYPKLWNSVVKTKEDAERVILNLEKAGDRCTENVAVSAVLNLRWSILFTSAIDAVSSVSTAKGYTLVPNEEKNAKRQYLNKDRSYRVSLCGNREAPPPNMNDLVSKKRFHKQIENKISWISNTYLEYYGVLVIDGLNMDYDWLTDELLFGQLFELPINSVFWFSAPEQLGENAALLVEQGILTVDEESFYEQMLFHMPELLEEKEQTSTDEDSFLYTPLTLQFGDKMRTAYISRAEMSDITGQELCILDDDAISGTMSDGKNTDRRFAEFLTQKNLPSWYFFNSRSSETSYYIPRDLDKDLEKDVSTALKNTTAPRKPIILEGPSNSGKSMMLANLAMKIAKRRKYPVIYIRGDLQPGAEKRLDNFIDNWFCNPERYNGEKPDKTLVIWDGNGLKRTERDYENLQKKLFNRNVQVVGSLYSSVSGKLVLSQELTADERKKLRKVLQSLGNLYAERFDEIQKKRNSIDVLKNQTLLYMLQALFKYEFDAEFKELRNLLAAQFKREIKYAEESTSKSIENYVDEFFALQRKRAESGVASSFKEKLQLILDRMAVQTQEASEPFENEDGKEEKLKKMKWIAARIEELNDILAVASEFGVQLPLHLVLHLLRDKNGTSYFAYGEETSKIIDILKSDTLINYEYRSHPVFGENYYVSFRNSIEAENYICLSCARPLGEHSPDRRQKELELLYKIIDLAETEVEIWTVVELARQFGPNGHGMLSEIGKMRKKNDYLEYQEDWLDIANYIIEKFPDNPEITLLYAHLIREYIVRQNREHKKYFEKKYEEARTRLETVLSDLENEGKGNRAQYDRLSVELCANYQQTLREKFNPVLYDNIKKRIRIAFQKSKGDSSDYRREFSSNYMLDILLNAYNEYQNSGDTAERANNELAEIICYIDDMLNLDDLRYEKTGEDLIEKIRDVYAKFGDSDSKIEQLKEQLMKSRSDAFLYLQARIIWQERVEGVNMNDWSANAMLMLEDRYLLAGKDVPYEKFDIKEELWEIAKNDARKVAAFLENKIDEIKKTESVRCLQMLMRAKWLSKTGNLMLAEKQCVSISGEEWREWIRLCDLYHSIHNENEDPFIPAPFLKGVYEWTYGNVGASFEWFNRAKSGVRSDLKMKSVERIVLCVENSNQPRTFIVDVKKSENRKFTASIFKETTYGFAGTNVDWIRYGIGVSDAVVKYLFDGAMPKENTQRSVKAGEIRFNLIGAQIGIPMKNGGN